MPHLFRPAPSIALHDDAALLVDRRRPGRLAVPDALIPLLRGQARPAASHMDGRLLVGDPGRDNLATALGITRGVMIGAAIWACMALAIIVR